MMAARSVGFRHLHLDVIDETWPAKNSRTCGGKPKPNSPHTTHPRVSELMVRRIVSRRYISLMPTITS